MKANFDQALACVLAHEGGYSNHPSDPGGPTKYGITLADFRRYVKADATARDVQAMTRAQAVPIYRTRYWDALSCNDLPAGLDYAVFDYGVNSGIARAAKVLRRLVGASEGTTLDAAILSLVRARDVGVLIRALCDERLVFLKSLKTWPVFGAGWGRRVGEVRATALAMVDASRQPATESVSRATAVTPAKAGSVVAAAATTAAAAHVTGAIWTTLAIAVAGLAIIGLAIWAIRRWRLRHAAADITQARAAEIFHDDVQ